MRNIGSMAITKFPKVPALPELSRFECVQALTVPDNAIEEEAKLVVTMPRCNRLLHPG